ncbi:carbohydrate-binding protein [Pyramidobacter sp.]|uniref:carbohydrate-binding protein n=1 Tax=Pyramidobacter sp. TaxID=1943581 RepID=UPI0033345CA9
MIPYSEGTLNVNNGSATVTGNATYWSSQVRPGDKLTLDHDVWYLVASVESDTSLTLDVPYHGATALTQDYVIVRDSSDWGMNAEIARDVTELMHLYKARLLDVLTHKFQVLGYYATLPALQNAVTSPAAGALYGIGESAPYSYYQWDGVANQWKNLGGISVAGNPGNSLRVRGVWAENTVYDAGENGFTDIVYCDNACFACMAAHTSATASKPNEGVSWRECWALLVAQGEMPNHEWNDTSVRFQRPDGTWGDWVNVLGPAEAASDTARTKAAEAATSANAAAASAGNATSSAQAAQTAASSAASSEEQAASSASAAAASQQSAAQSADLAASSASTASASQTAAAASAAAALASQNAAQTAESSAASSAEQSAASANAAAASQQSAAQSAEAAAQTAQSVNQWRHRGEWASGTDYLSGGGYIDVVEHDGSSYVCLAAHQATTANEPGVGVSFADFWRLLAEKGQPGFVFTPALVDGVLNWTNNGGLSNPASVDLFKAPTEGVQNLGTRTGNTTIDCALGNYVIMTIGALLTLSFTAAANGRLRVLTLELINGGSATVTWPASVKWADGAAPVLTAAGKDLITLMTRDDGATWYGTVVGSDFK